MSHVQFVSLIYLCENGEIGIFNFETELCQLFTSVSVSYLKNTPMHAVENSNLFTKSLTFYRLHNVCHEMISNT